MRVVFTGGSGKAGRHAIPVLLEAGHEVTNWTSCPSTTRASARSRWS